MKFLAKIFATLYRFKRIEAWLKRDYDCTLYNSERVYMYRFNVVRANSIGSLLLRAVTLGKYTECRLHGIMLADGDRELHNHPFHYRTFILRGWYVEQRPDPKGRVFPVAHTEGESATGQGYHRICTVPKEGVWTLFFVSRKNGNRDWGFLVDGKHVPSKEFFARRGNVDYKG